ncbi:LPS export ABC transporter protein LptC [Dysgonomonas sp. PFB1-18]|uniref:LPS export ABC transporter periplasmic protein LptC n=1 Tax=unclassified Dysgonomonas TaxID=2630389 RepID=UPI002475CCF8|nr:MULTISPECIES: LPS export ABC transporter periplasmic protein LptC [unclassified Dysgonomonas]MDH6310501.1 LPS export ABC transporter protein LptC [Dysgonomonas sp. PF1-14]MDH6340351.1 LPS export ABC transporter protein LptC [Dysgonomonas sp. PF1-16]MDH6382069.1 LPS export ABC transporter protein LptC [Dysgonomonas sp. PFB1-18]MDH6399322.1 LPS export ABC transporter protein LptC [Dysgonomonas sp. PF1-23]
MKLIQRNIFVFVIVILFFAMPFFFASCKQESKAVVDFRYNKDSVPSMSTDSVDMLISDSGLIRYRMLAKIWNVFDQAKDPYWHFPKGLYLEQFDTTFNIVVTVKADTAWNYERRKLWRLKGHVFVRNTLGETFSGDELFWNQQQQKIYSEKPVEIDRPAKALIIAEGFTSNQEMTEYEFSRVHKSKVYVEENKESQEADKQEKAE